MVEEGVLGRCRISLQNDMITVRHTTKYDMMPAFNCITSPQPSDERL